MDISYKVLEKDYYKALRTIAFSLKIKNKSITKIKLPYLLENATLFRLKPKRRWIISAISGSGKTTISKYLVTANYKKIPNVTTRPRRFGEKFVDYFFVSNSKFLSLKKRNLLFHPHKRNEVWHAIMKKDIGKFNNKKSKIYLDKSVASSLALINSLPKKTDFNYVFILPPTFNELYKRMKKRERSRDKKEYLSKKQIFKRFEEEIKDMQKSIELPYIYVVNDSLPRVRTLIRRALK